MAETKKEVVVEEVAEVKEIVAKDRPIDSVFVSDGVYKYVYTDTGEDKV